MSSRTPKAARNVWRQETPGSTCGCAWSAGKSVAATPRRTATPRLIITKPNIRSCGLSNPEKAGVGATLMSCMSIRGDRSFRVSPLQATQRMGHPMRRSTAPSLVLTRVRFVFDENKRDAWNNQRRAEEHSRGDHFSGEEVAEGDGHHRVDVSMAGNAGCRHAPEQPYKSTKRY